LRIGWTDRAPLPPHAGPAARRALADAVGLLRGLGHEVRRADPPYGDVPLAFAPRYLRGARDDLARLVDPRAVRPRTAAVARLGSLVPLSAVAAARRRGEAVRDRVRARLAGVAVLALPVQPEPAPPAAPLEAAGVARTLRRSTRLAAYTSPWNAMGLPAVSVPVGATTEGLPLAVQLVALDGDLAQLVALAASLEGATRWPERRPPLAMRS